MSVHLFSLAKLDEMDQLLTRQMGKRILDPRDLSSVLLDVPINAKCDQDLVRRMLKCCYGEGGRRHSWRSCCCGGYQSRWSYFSFELGEMYKEVSSGRR
jgi:hypothetical protein